MTDVQTLDRVVIRFAGDSGDGMQLTGDRFTSDSASLGNDFATLPNFPAEIRAPQGTIAGVSSFQLHFANDDIKTPGDAPDVLVAMNPAALALAWGAAPGVLLGGGTGPDGLEAALRAAGQAWYRRQLPAAEPAWRWEAPVMAQTMGHLAVRLSRPAGEESPEDERARAWRGWRDVARLRRRISDGLFEMLAYEQPHTDLHGLYSEIQEHYLGYSRHPERLWPAVPSLAARPGHLAALITGLLAADQIAESLRRRHGGTLASPAIAAELSQAFAAPGARIPWETRLADFTGRVLDAGATLRRLGADPDS